MKIDLQLLANAVTDEIVKAVINGQYGNGTARKTALTNAGYDYSEVQAAVNAKLGGTSSTTTTPTTTTASTVNNGFKYDDYAESDTVKNSLTALNTHNAAKPADYQSKYGSLVEEAANAWANRDKFSYDLNGDALYQQYKDKYINQGRLAMQDTIGQASAMTGGYGNSYAATAGNQAYQASLQNLNDIVPQLYQMAYDQYKQEGQDMLNKYNLYNDMETKDYNRYRDTVSDWTSERDYLANVYNNERTYDWNVYDSNRDFAYGTWSDQRKYDYQVARDAVEDNQWQQSYDLQKNSGGSGSTAKTWDVDDYHTVMYEAQGLSGDNDALANYLKQMVTAGIITDDEQIAIWDAYKVKETTTETPKTESTTVKTLPFGTLPQYVKY